jgi:S1-C subfamily serine protease
MDEHELEGTHRMEMPKPFVVQRDDGAGLVMMRPPGFFVLAADGLFGARMSTVSAALSRALKLDTGVLVNDVSDGTPAERAGLKAGDVIVAAAAKPVATVEQLRRVIARQLREQSIELQVVRDKKARRITVTW